MKRLVVLLFSRLFLFLFFQILIALFLNSWDSSAKYWILSATFTNVISIIIVYFCLRQENTTFFSIFKFQKTKWKIDFLWFLVFVIISVPVAIAPSLTISKLLWGNAEYYHQVLFQPLDRHLIYILLFVYPISTGLIELATYFGYIMPRLKSYIKSGGLIIAIPVIAFSLQHCTLPLVLESKFIFFRGVMYLIFSLVYGIALYKRPSLLPWLAILQTLIYILPVLMLMGIS
jgi:membrane protease YdiL (CAAX protease family)